MPFTSTKSRAALAAAAALALSAGITAAPNAQDRPFYDQSDSYGEQRRPSPTSRAPRRDDSYRPPEDYSGVPGGFGKQADSYGQPPGAPRPYDRPSDAAQTYGGQPSQDRGYDRPAYEPPRGPPPSYGSPGYNASPDYRAGPPPDDYRGGGQPPYRQSDAYSPAPGSPQGGPRQDGYGNEPYNQPGANGGYGQPYAPPPGYDAPPGGPGSGYGQGYPPEGRGGYDEPRRAGGTYSQNEVIDSGHRFFGSISQGLANAVEHVFKNQGRPNGYILGEDAGGAFIAGLRYGEGTLYTKDAGNHRVFWQGPSLGYDFGGEGSKTMVLVYNLRDPAQIYDRYGGVQGSAYVIGGIGVQFQKHENVTLAVIRSGVGLRLGANVGYLKYTRTPTWNPF